MTLSTTLNHEQYTGNGVTTVFGFRFLIFKESHLSVTVRDLQGNLTTLVLGSDYTVSGVNNEDGGTVNLAKPLANGWEIAIDRDVPAIQETSFRNQGKFFAENHENAFDYLTMLIQRALAFFGLALSKPTAISRYYDAKNLPVSNLADPNSDQDAVNRRSMRSFVEAMIAGVVGGYGYFTQRGTAPVPRTFQEKMREQISITDYGASEANADNTAALLNAISAAGAAGEVLLPNNSTVEATKYRVGNFLNKLGTTMIGRGALVKADPNGGIRQVNFHQDQFADVLGYEYLFPVYQQFVPGQGDINGQLGVLFAGDSTVRGDNGETTQFKLATFFTNQLSRLGLPNVLVTNRGVSGSSVGDMNSDGQVTADINAGKVQLLIIKYGINDGGNGRADRLDYFFTNFRAKLTALRALPNGIPQKLSIIIVGPNSTNDSPNNRNAYWYEQLRPGLLQLARDYQCAYFDTYGMMPDSYGLAGYALDAPSILAPGVGIHPLDSMQAWIWGKFIDKYFNRSTIAQYATNHLRNSGAISGAPVATTLAINYDFGVNIYRAKVSDGWPFDGTALTIRHVDQPCIQHLFNFDNGVSRCITRTFNTTTSTWQPWTGVANGLTLAGGWTASDTPVYRISADGMVNVSARISGGTTTSGTTVLTGIPAAFRPAVEKRFAVANDTGTMTSVGINVSTGNIFLVGSTTASPVHINFSYHIG